MVELEKTGNSGHLFGGSLPRADCVLLRCHSWGRGRRKSVKTLRWQESFTGPRESWKRKRRGVAVLKCSCSGPSISPSTLRAPGQVIFPKQIKKWGPEEITYLPNFTPSGGTGE